MTLDTNIHAEDQAAATGGTLAVIYADPDPRVQYWPVAGAGLSENEAKWLLDYVHAEQDPSAFVTDLLPGVQARFPIGARVFLGRRVHWRNDGGVVVEGEPENHARWPESGRSPWFVDSSSAQVCVLLDGATEPSWWPATWLDTIDGATEIAALIGAGRRG